MILLVKGVLSSIFHLLCCFKSNMSLFSLKHKYLVISACLASLNFITLQQDLFWENFSILIIFKQDFITPEFSQFLPQFPLSSPYSIQLHGANFHV